MSFAIVCTSTLYASGQSASPAWNWVKLVGGGIGNESTCFGITADADGNTYITGSFTGTGQFGQFILTTPAQTYQLYVAKINTSGVYQWVRSVSGFGKAQGESLALDATGNIYVTGQIQGQFTFGNSTLTSANGTVDILVAKLNSNGEWVWANIGGGPGLDIGRGIAVSAAGTVFITGQIRDRATFGNITLQATAGFADIFVGALDANAGQWQWGRCAIGNGSSNNYGYAVKANSQGEAYVVCSFIDQAVFGGTTLTATGGTDVCIAKLSSTGAWLWARQGGGSGTDYARSIAIDRQGNAYVVGWYTGPATFGSTILTGFARIFVAKIDANGIWQWATASNRVGNGDSAFGRGIALDSREQSVYITGNFSGGIIFGNSILTATGPFDQYVASLDINGVWQWAQQANGVGRIVTANLVSDPNGMLYTCGYADNNANFGQAVMLHPNPPAEQAYVAKLTASTVASVQSSAQEKATLWPCPASSLDPIHVRWSVSRRPTMLIVCDVLGREIHRQTISENHKSEVTFPAPKLPGWYQCQILFDGTQPLLQKILVQH
ncbi:SBBP repeat-containing protein [Hymenobacter tibetensis]|uniref:SBBP repeat-containing protein n=1 Tax=Hymenobacter tibetensis TaxID=497967 RepID=A0ABY4CVA4_9BACT|nr:SBBP repeat-containing protein [Hymenobacter tibetensis]UOG73967.1 SBBP repeat-containing protein [Hymenobacter tibetensis]